MSQQQYDLAVIGGGPGGYVAAIRAAQLGMNVVCIEREALGGICLNWGCIPTKALLRSAEILELCRHADQYGILVDNVRFDFPAIIKRSRDISTKINKGVGFLFKKNNITHIAGTASLPSADTIAVTLTDGGNQSLQAKNIIIATGARARELPGLSFNGETIIDYRKAMTLSEVPDHLAVIGAGAIGVEFASFYRALGSQVTIIEYQDSLVPNEDQDVRNALTRAFQKRGIDFKLAHKVTQANPTDDGITLFLESVSDGTQANLDADKVLVAAGITGNTEDIGLESLGIATNRSFIEVDSDLQTGVRGIFAIGDVIGPPALAHVASAEGVYVAEYLAGMNPPKVPYESIPACTYCHPEIASVGLTEAQAQEQNIPTKIGKFPFKPLGKAIAAGETEGFVKIIYHAETGAVIGSHMIGPAVTDLISEMTLAKTTEVNAESLVYTVHAHPTFAEALKEASEDALGHAIHL